MSNLNIDQPMTDIQATNDRPEVPANQTDITMNVANDENAHHDMERNALKSEGSELTDDDFDDVSRAQKSTSITSNLSEGKEALHPDFSSVQNQILPPISDEIITATGSYTWEINNFSRLSGEKTYSPVFTIGGQGFRVLLFPRGNGSNNIALYLAPVQPTKTAIVNGEETEVPVDPKWYTCAQFTLILSNPNDPRNCIVNTSHQRFNKMTTDWGFSTFTDYKNLTHSRRDFGPLLADNSLHVTAYIKILKDETGVLWHNLIDYDSKTETGFVGFNNQGATCYLNSLLQSYYFTKSFRKAVYQIPTEDAEPENSVPLALQRIFYQLQRSDDAVDTQELTKSFGWDNSESFTQHDVQELNRILMDRLESSMKSTSVDSELNDTFVGKMKSYIKCINVNYESSRVEDFWDIQLNVKNFHNLTESFQDYISTEVLEGENQYSTPDFGMQDAQKGVIFEKLPSVLHLQLKRFEFDFERETLSKVNDRHEFPESIDLSPFLERQNGEEVKPCIYDLHGVLIHAGDIANGHYYTMIRPDESDKWYRFDDDRVWRVTKRQVFEENFGMAEQPIERMTKQQYQTYQIRRQTNAYMLVYIKRDDKARILQNVADTDAPAHVCKDVEEDLVKKAKEKKDRADQYLYTKINFYTQSLSNDFEGFDLGSHDRFEIYEEKESKPLTLKVLKIKLCKDFLPEIAQTLNLDPEQVTWWAMSFRRNGSLRPAYILEDIDNLTVDQLHETRFSTKQEALNIWIEDHKESIIPVSKALATLDGYKEDSNQTLVEQNKVLNLALLNSQISLIILKFFDVASQKLKLLSHVRVPGRSPIKELFQTVSGSLGLPFATEFRVYEELAPNDIQELEPKHSFDMSELGNGDILIFDVKENHSNTNDLYPFYDNAIDYCEYLLTRTVANIKMLNNCEDEDNEYVLVNATNAEDSTAREFQVPVCSADSVEELSILVGRKIDKDPEFIRFVFSHGGTRYIFRSPMTIGLLTSKGVDLNFQYEILSIPLKQLENMQTVKINWLPSSFMHSQELEFNLDKNANVSDLIDKMANKLNLTEDQKAGLFVWSTLQNQFNSVLYPIQRLEQDGSELYAAIQPDIVEATKFNTATDGEDDDEEFEISENAPILFPVMHFSKDIRRKSHGISFLFGFNQGETLSHGIKRLQDLTGLGSKEFSKIKLCFWDNERAPVYFRNPIVDPSHAAAPTTDDGLVNPDTFVPSSDCSTPLLLCLDHPDRSTRAAGYHAGGISIR